MKPKFELHPNDSNYDLIDKAAWQLLKCGLLAEAKAIHKEACSYGYEFYAVLILLKKYVQV